MSPSVSSAQLHVVPGVLPAFTAVNVPTGAKVTLTVVGGDAAWNDRLQRHYAVIERLARISAVEPSPSLASPAL